MLEPRQDEAPASHRSRGRRRPPRRRKTMRIRPKVVLAAVCSLAFVGWCTWFVVDTHRRNSEADITPLTLDEMMRMAKDPFAPDPEEDAIKAQAAQRYRLEALRAERQGRKGLSPVYIAKTAPGGRGFPSFTFPPGSKPDPGSNKALGKQMNAARGWDAEWGCLERLWDKESGWNERAANRYSGAYGIPQSLPGSKMAAAGPDWQTNPATQIKWGLDYIAGRYGSPCKAWAHSQAKGWY
ncbi:hypothetical protein FHX40_0328 [Thermopolyspora flexuosa]|uniref:Transglycosylase-like protein with SLT domain n=2 Tax=Thermopolyspora flexuosa TaxID=103836 RepID=A0A543ISW7_9ACTN|nr:hypothetical protein FHX40_0328 [Thermopolyspora flexuosa]